MLIVRNPLKENHLHFFWVLSLCSCLNFLLLGFDELVNHYFEFWTQELFFFSFAFFFLFTYKWKLVGNYRTKQTTQLSIAS